MVSIFLFLSVSCISANGNATDIVPVEASNSFVEIDSKSFSALQKEIKDAKPNSKLYLKHSYKYNRNYDSSLKNGVKIDKDLTIIGKSGCTIDGAGLARCLRVMDGCSVSLQNLKIKNGFSTSGGAGIKAYSHSKLDIRNCEFSNNVAKNSNGGAIDAKEYCTIKIFSSTFKNNKATRTSKLPWEKDKKGMGGAIKTSLGTKLEIRNSKFTSNSAYLSIILVVSFTNSIKKTSSLKVDNCVFTKNKSQHNGVIYLDEYGKCTIVNSAFSKNKSIKGAGIIVVESSKYAMIKNCVFYRNTGLNGAAINIKIYSKRDSMNVKIYNCKFNKNYASMYGGAICSVGGTFTVKNCQFTSNKAKIFGGGIYSRLGKASIFSSKFSKNIAEYAGALCMACKKSTVKRCSITNNRAYYLYGGVYNIEHNKLSKCHIKSNKNLNYTKISLYKSKNHIKVKIYDNKDKPIKKQVKLTFKGTKKIKTKWYKTSTKKFKKIKIPKSVKGAYKVSIKIKKARYFSKTIDIMV